MKKLLCILLALAMCLLLLSVGVLAEEAEPEAAPAEEAAPAPEANLGDAPEEAADTEAEAAEAPEEAADEAGDVAPAEEEPDPNDLVASVEVGDVTRLETDTFYGRWVDDDTGEVTGPYEFTNVWPNSVHVVMKDGREFVGGLEEVWDLLYETYEYGFSYAWGDIENWTPGELLGPGDHTVTFYVGNAFTTYTVTVIEDPVASVEVAPITRYDTDLDGWTGYYDAELDQMIDVGEPWRIDCWPRQAEVAVTLKDGRTIACPADELEEKLEEAVGYPLLIWWDSDENPGDIWGPGDHTATLQVGGVVAEYAVTVVPSPTVKLAADGATAKLEGDYTGLYVRVALVLQLNDGKSGLYVTQGAINKDGTVVMPAFYVPGLTVRGVNVALVRSLDEIPSSTPRVISSDFQYAS